MNKNYFIRIDYGIIRYITTSSYIPHKGWVFTSSLPDPIDKIIGDNYFHWRKGTTEVQHSISQLFEKVENAKQNRS